jgi:hypothetical protein
MVARIGAVVRGQRPSQITLPLENNAKVERADGVTALVRATECLLRSDQVSSLAQDHAIFGGCTSVTAPVSACERRLGAGKISKSFKQLAGPESPDCILALVGPVASRLGTCETAVLFEQHAQMSRGSKMSPLVRPTISGLRRD